MTKINLIRILLTLLLIADMIFVFSNSAANSTDSSAKSQSVTEVVAPVVVPTYNQMTQSEKQETVRSLNAIVREAAHMIQFMPIGFCAYLLLATFSTEKKKLALFLPITLIFGFAYAVTDELHQLSVPGRAFQWLDIGLDMSGVAAGLACAVILLLLLSLIRKKLTKIDQ